MGCEVQFSGVAKVAANASQGWCYDRVEYSQQALSTRVPEEHKIPQLQWIGSFTGRNISPNQPTAQQYFINQSLRLMSASDSFMAGQGSRLGTCGRATSERRR